MSLVKNIFQQMFGIAESCMAVLFTQLRVIAIFEDNNYTR